VQKDPDGADRRVDALRRIREVRGTGAAATGCGLLLGVYGDVEEAGPVRVGDPVTTIGPTGRPN
jgi:hypothetical protein